jgi:hypothetical protein
MSEQYEREREGVMQVLALAVPEEQHATDSGLDMYQPINK